MASSDAKPVPQKGVAFRVTFPILDINGDLVTGAADLDSEISLDGGTFDDCTNEATEIATSSGMYYLDLTSGEMNADTVAILVKTSTATAKTTPLVFYPQEEGDIWVNVTQWNNESSMTAIVRANVISLDASTAAVTNLVTAYSGPFFLSSSVSDGSPAAGNFDGDSGLSSSDDFYNDCALVFTSGTLKGITRRITDFTGSTRNLVFTTAFPTAPSNGDTFVILGRIE